MAIIINVSRNVSRYDFNEMLAKLRPQKDGVVKKEALSEEKVIKQPELSKKEEVKSSAALAPEAEPDNIALSSKSDFLEEDIENLPAEEKTEEILEETIQNEFEIVVKPDELPNKTTGLLNNIEPDDKMDYDGDGEVTIAERMRYMQEQADEQFNSAINKTGRKTLFSSDEIKTKEIGPTEKNQQDNVFNKEYLHGVHKFNYNNLQNAYLKQENLQTEQPSIALTV